MDTGPDPSAPRSAADVPLVGRIAEQLRAWSGVVLLALGLVVGYRVAAAGAPITGLLMGGAMAGLGAFRTYHLCIHLLMR